MSGFCSELYASRMQTQGDNIGQRSTATFEILATGYDDEPSAIAAVITYVGPTYGTMNYSSTELTERLNNSPNVWKFKVKFLDVPATVFNYDSSGGTQHITQSLATVNKYAATGSAPDYKGAIGFDGENVAGVDIVVPVFTYTETVYLTDAQLNSPLYYALTGSVNSDTFQGNPPGSVLFYGATAQEREDGLWEAQFKFGVSANKTGLAVGPITGITKAGWDYLWIYYGKSVNANQKIKVPLYAYVEQVYPRAALSSLGI